MYYLKTIKTLLVQKACFFLFFLVLSMGIASSANATAIMESSACYYTVNGNNYIKFEINQSSWGWISSTPGSVGNTFVTVKLYDASYNLIGTYISAANSPVMMVNVGSVSGPYHIQAYIDVYQGASVIYHTDLTNGGNSTYDITVNCSSVPEPNGYTDGCFSVSNNETGSTSIVKVNLDPSFLTFMSFYNYYPVLAIADGGTYYGFFTASSVSGTAYTFNVSASVNLDPNKCYQGYIYLKDQNNNLVQQYEYTFELCQCPPSRSCVAEFKINASDFGGNIFGLQCTSSNLTSIASEYWTITSGGTTIWSGSVPTAWLLPYGGYTICHKVTTIYGETCEYCTDYCFTGNTKGGLDGGKNKSIRPAAVKQPDGNTSLSRNGNDLRINYFSANDTRVNLVVYNSLGQVIMQKSGVVVTKGNNSIAETMPAVSSGVYYLQINSSDHSSTSKFVVE